MKPDEISAILVVLRESDILDEDDKITTQFLKRVQECGGRCDLGEAMISTLNYYLHGQEPDISSIAKSFFIHTIQHVHPILTKALEKYKIKVGESEADADMKLIKKHVGMR